MATSTAGYPPCEAREPGAATSGSAGGGGGSSRLRALSLLESSDNANNVALLASGSQLSAGGGGVLPLPPRQQQQQQPTRADSYSAVTGGRPELLRQVSVGSSVQHRSGGCGGGGHRDSSSGGSGTAGEAAPLDCDAPVPVDGAEVVIEEKRRRASGDGYSVHLYRRGRLLGKGGFAKVYLCTALDTNKNYAVKVVPKANLVKARARQKLQTEIKIHRTLKHEHICEYKHFFEDRDNCYILLELCHNQSMNELIKRRKRLTEPEAAFFVSQLLRAVRYMHDKNVIHRDLKLGNLFLDRNVHIKVGDLGLACRLEDRDEKRKTICGTPNYIAPEVIQGEKSKRGHSFEVDVWSVGVILYTILVGKPPYEAKDVKATYQRILNNEYSFPSHVPLSENAKDLIQSLLQSNPAHRPTISKIEAHPFLAWNVVPTSLPSSVLHIAPTWAFDEHGEVSLVRKEDQPAGKSLGKGSFSCRQPFGFRDPNVKSSTTDSKQPVESGIDMQRIARTALAISNSSGSAKSMQPALSKSDFRIFDESHGVRSSTTREKPPTAPSSRTFGEDALVRRTLAMSISDTPQRFSDNPRNQSTASCAVSLMSATSGVGGDTEVLLRISDRLDAVLMGAMPRGGVHRGSQVRPVSLCYGPRKWVTRYVDYTTKYGLGFLLNDQCAGVYFNDSTKTVLDSVSDTFQYIERRKADDSGRAEALIETYTLSNYPESLKKKVTLLKHFRNYLMEHQKGPEEEVIPTSSTPHLPTNFVFVKKWLRTKHAILFRLSNQTVQVVFYDQTEILMTPDDRYITYVDKNRSRTTYNFTSELVTSSPEMEKRLRYTKEIISQLITGRR